MKYPLYLGGITPTFYMFNNFLDVYHQQNLCSIKWVVRIFSHNGWKGYGRKLMWRSLRYVLALTWREGKNRDMMPVPCVRFRSGSSFLCSNSHKQCHCPLWFLFNLEIFIFRECQNVGISHCPITCSAQYSVSHVMNCFLKIISRNYLMTQLIRKIQKVCMCW